MSLRHQLAFFLLLIAFPVSSPAQRILGAVSAGMNLTQVDGDEKYGFHKVGFNGGPSVIIPFGKDKKWSVTMELLFSMLGSKARSQYSPYDTIKDTTELGYYDGYKLYLSYVQVPLLVHFTDKKVIAAGVGFQFGQLVGAKEYEDYNDERGFYRTETTLRSPYTLNDLQVLADVRIRLWKRLWVNGRYGYSLFPTRTREFTNPYNKDKWTRKQYNNVITLRLTYIFNEVVPVKTKNKGK